MSISDILADIRKLKEIEERNAETNFEILSKNSELLNHPDYSNFVSELVSNSEDPENKEILKLFAKFGADINILQNFDEVQHRNVTPGSRRPVIMVTLRLTNGKKLKGPEWMWCLPASRIFCRSNIEIRKDLLILLLKHGLDVSTSGYMSSNIFQQFIRYFVEKDDEDVQEILEILINAGASVDDGLSDAVIRTESTELVSSLIAKGADVNKPTKYGSLPLCLAAERDKIDFVNLLLVNGADINAKDKAGDTALHGACTWNRPNIISLLLSKGAKISPQDNTGRTPISTINFTVDQEKQSMYIMVKEFAKLNFNSCPILQEDLDIIKAHQNSREYFESCQKELHQMSITKFYSFYSYTYVLKVSKNFKKLVSLTKNREFVASFEKNLSFLHYKNDLRRIFEEAIQARNESEALISRLYLALGNFFPEIVIRKLEENLNLKDIPLE